MSADLEKKKQRCNQILESLVGPSLVDLWWTSPNKAFNLTTPENQWDLDYKKVVNYLLNQLNGDYS